jgi:hypothetical protein
MGTNVGATDRVFRITAGLVILSLFFGVDGAIRWWSLLGLVPLASGLIAWCPAYLALGISTCARDRLSGPLSRTRVM